MGEKQVGIQRLQKDNSFLHLYFLHLFMYYRFLLKSKIYIHKLINEPILRNNN